jgi:drug/metabolite transporter (DMT)-like permease
MVLIVRAREGTLRGARADPPLLLTAWVLGITLNQIGFAYALTDTSASDVALLGATGPILTALLATAVGLERLGRRYWLSVAIGMPGVVLIVGGSAAGRARRMVAPRGCPGPRCDALLERLGAPHPAADLACAVILTGVVSSLLYCTGIERVGPSRAALFGYLQSFLGVLFAVGLLGERGGSAWACPFARHAPARMRGRGSGTTGCPGWVARARFL